jgi:hypothetical protein
MRCPVCREKVGVYTPTGAPTLRRVEYHPPWGATPCSGSFGIPMTEDAHQRDIDATQRWAASRHFTDQPGG